MGDSEVNGANEAKKQKRAAITAEYIENIVSEKHKLKVEEHPIANRLLSEELKKAQETEKATFDYRYIDVYNDKPIKISSRIMFPTKEFPTFNFVGKLLGPKGATLKQLQEATRSRIFILGRGSMRDKAQEDALRAGGDPKYAHLSDELHVEVSVLAPPYEAHSRMAFALRELRALLVPDPPAMNDDYYGEEGMMRGPVRSLLPPAASKAKVMGFLEKARQSMEYQGPPMPRRPNWGPGRPSWGYEEEYEYPPAPPHPPRGGGEGRGWGGFKQGGGQGFFPPRSTPYARP